MVVHENRGHGSHIVMHSLPRSRLAKQCRGRLEVLRPCACQREGMDLHQQPLDAPLAYRFRRAASAKGSAPSTSKCHNAIVWPRSTSESTETKGTALVFDCRASARHCGQPAPDLARRVRDDSAVGQELRGAVALIYRDFHRRFGRISGRKQAIEQRDVVARDARDTCSSADQCNGPAARRRSRHNCATRRASTGDAIICAASRKSRSRLQWVGRTAVASIRLCPRSWYMGRD